MSTPIPPSDEREPREPPEVDVLAGELSPRELSARVRAVHRRMKWNGTGHGRLRFGGLLAWLAWMALHITVLIGFRNRLAVLSSWVYSYVFFRRGSRLITRTGPPEQS